MDHGAMDHGLMTGMYVAGVIFSAVPLAVAIAFGVFLLRQLRAARADESYTPGGDSR
jgi:hypothetical protein